MVAKTVTLLNAEGLHMRPAAVFAKAMGAFRAAVTLQSGDKKADGKSMISIMLAAMKCGDSVTVSCEGEDENEALERAVALIEAGLEEGVC